MLKVCIDQRHILANHRCGLALFCHLVHTATDVFGLPGVHILHAVEHIVLGQDIPVFRIRARGSKTFTRCTRENMVDTLDAFHHQRNDVGVRDGLLIVEESIGKLYLYIATRITIVVNGVRCQLVVGCWHRQHRSGCVSAGVREIEVVAK